MLRKNLENYVSAGVRSLLNITSFDNILEVHVSYDIKAKMMEMPECETMLRKLFNSKLVIRETENSDENKPEEENKMEKIYTNQKPGMNLPKLVCPFKDKRRGWNKSTARDQAQLYLNLLEYGLGGRKSLVTTKFKTAEKPKFWPDSISFEKYDHPSSVSVSANEDLIESILEFYGYNIKTHCHSPKKQEKKKRQTKKKEKKSQLQTEDINDNTETEEESKSSGAEENTGTVKTTEQEPSKKAVRWAWKTCKEKEEH